MSKQLMIVKPGTINPKDKEKLTKNGIVIIEHPEPDSVKIIVPVSEIQSNDFLMSALFAVQQSSLSKQVFAEELYKRLKIYETPTENKKQSP